MTSSVDLPELLGSDLPGLFEGAVTPGVYRCASVGPDVLMQAEAAKWADSVIDLQGVTDKQDFMDRAATGLELPAWFGRNWDAFADCLTDLPWTDGSHGCLVMTAGWPDLEKADPASAGTAADIFRAAVGFWSERDRPLAVLLG